MTVQALARRINSFGFLLLEKDYALDVKPHVASHLSAETSTIRWTREDESASLIVDDVPGVHTYITLLERRDFSYLMRDGGLIQIAMTFLDGAIERHRMLCFPCPFVVDAGLMTGPDAALTDVIREIYLSDVLKYAVLKTPIRFDLAPEAENIAHPASHLTLNDSCCRIPVREAMQFDNFMTFVFENFYPDIWQDASIREMLVRVRSKETLSDEDRLKAHMNWAYA